MASQMYSEDLYKFIIKSRKYYKKPKDNYNVYSLYIGYEFIMRGWYESLDFSYGTMLKKYTISRKKSAELVRVFLTKYSKWLNRQLKRHIPQNHFDALLSLMYDIGPFKFRLSKAFRCYMSGRIHEVPENILVWTTGHTGRFEKRWAIRRKIEHRIFTKNEYKYNIGELRDVNSD